MMYPPEERKWQEYHRHDSSDPGVKEYCRGHIQHEGPQITRMPQDPVGALADDCMAFLDRDMHREKAPQGENCPGSQQKPQCHSREGDDCHEIPFDAPWVPQIGAFEDRGELCDVDRPDDLGSSSPVDRFDRNG